LSVIVVFLQKRLGKDYQSRKPQLCCNEGKCNGPLMAHCPHNLTNSNFHQQDITILGMQRLQVEEIICHLTFEINLGDCLKAVS
jgi:hypothetical protein